MNVESIMTGGAARFAAAGLAAAGLAAAGFGAVRPARRLDPLVFLKVAVTGGRGRRGFMNVESIMPGGQATPARADGHGPTRLDG
ncbi:hypothetical protein ACIBTW_09985 [Micromonospora parva]|uniref:hypothetical protein n=1 Tax=Micromonospora parva TaxID=1464048 RepID=UPI0037B8E714